MQGTISRISKYTSYWATPVHVSCLASRNMSLTTPWHCIVRAPVPPSPEECGGMICIHACSKTSTMKHVMSMAGGVLWALVQSTGGSTQYPVIKYIVCFVFLLWCSFVATPLWRSLYVVPIQARMIFSKWMQFLTYVIIVACVFLQMEHHVAFLFWGHSVLWRVQANPPEFMWTPCRGSPCSFWYGLLWVRALRRTTLQRNTLQVMR